MHVIIILYVLYHFNNSYLCGLFDYNTTPLSLSSLLLYKLEGCIIPIVVTRLVHQWCGVTLITEDIFLAIFENTIYMYYFMLRSNFKGTARAINLLLFIFE